MRTRFSSRASTSIAALALAASSISSAAASTDGGLRDQLQRLMLEAKIPGLAVAVLVDGEVVRTEALGWAEIERQRPMQASTVLNIGSVSKLVTSSAVLQLWEEGEIELDVDVSRYLPFPVRHPAGDNPITVRQLLTHTSGIQDGPSYGASYACGDPLVSLEEWLRGYLVPVLHRTSDGVSVLAMTNSLVVEEFRPLLALLFAHGASFRSATVTNTDPNDSGLGPDSGV